MTVADSFRSIGARSVPVGARSCRIVGSGAMGFVFAQGRAARIRWVFDPAGQARVA